MKAIFLLKAFCIILNLQGSQTGVVLAVSLAKFCIILNLQGSQTVVIVSPCGSGFVSFLTYKVLKHLELTIYLPLLFCIILNLQGSQTSNSLKVLSEHSDWQSVQVLKLKINDTFTFVNDANLFFFHFFHKNCFY